MIDFLLHYYGSVGRSEIMNYFVIEQATATRDFASYRSKAPGNAILNPSTKRWVRSDSFKRIYE